MVNWLTGPAPISRELSSIGAGSALRYEILDPGAPGQGCWILIRWRVRKF